MEAAATIKDPTAQPAEKVDRTGRSRLVSNVLFTWGGQMVFFVSGFIMPRMIKQTLGQEVLGVWDFSWSLIGYFRFVDMGVTASVNRYVARHWGKNEIEGVNRVVSSATFALLLAAVVILIGTMVGVVTLPYWYGSHALEYLKVTQESVLCLGVMLAAQTALGAYNGVLTGCHRWELQTMRNSLWQFIAVVGMLVSLWLGFGLVALAVVTAVCQILGQLTMVTLAYRACPGLKIKRSYIDKATIKELYIYSGKTLLPTISDMMLNQVIVVLITGNIGLLALAVFTRPRSLLRQMDSLERKMGMILIPTTSSLQGSGNLKEVKTLLTKSTAYALYLSLPLILVMVAFGGVIIRFWMGAGFEGNWVPAILALGFIGISVQESVLAILIGLNAHGRGGVAQMVASIISVLMALFMMHYLGASLIIMAIAVTVPQMIVGLVYLPWMGCRDLGMSYWGFLRDGVGKPCLPFIPFAACLGLARWLYDSYMIASVLVASFGVAILAMHYWSRVVPPKLKNSLLNLAAKRGLKFLKPKAAL